MRRKLTIKEKLNQATVDKTGLNKTIISWKKHFDEVNKVLDNNKKKKD